MAKRLALFHALIVGTTITTGGALARPGQEDPISMGSLCVAPREVNRSIAIIRNSGGKARHDPEARACLNGLDSSTEGIRVPYGLEGWSLNLLRREVRSARYQFGTAGGGGENRSQLNPSIFFDGHVEPTNLRESNLTAACKIRTRLRPFFDDITNFAPCPKNLDPNELCWRVWLGGHTAKTRGFQGGRFATIGPRYWVSSKVDILIGAYQNYTGWQGGSNLGSQIKLEIFTISSVYARKPSTDKPTGGDYHPISFYEPKIDGDELDQDIAGKLVDLLAVNQKLRCEQN